MGLIHGGAGARVGVDRNHLLEKALRGCECFARNRRHDHPYAHAEWAACCFLLESLAKHYILMF